MTINDYDQIDLTLVNGSISTYHDPKLGAELKGFQKRLSQKSVPKLYIITKNEDILYIGTTMQPIGSRLKYGLKYANGKNGYHGYKWKQHQSVRLYAWSFPELNKEQLEAIEAELAFATRESTGKWPISQNEIHFNNSYPAARETASKIYQIIYQENSKLKNPFPISCIFHKRPFQWGLRGDEFLWEHLKKAIKEAEITSIDELVAFLTTEFEKKTGHPPLRGKAYKVTEFSHGGMSSGMVSSDFWMNTGFPLLVKRLKAIQELYN